MRFRSPSARSLLRPALAGLLGLFLCAAPAGAEDLPLQLAVSINGRPTGLIAEFTERDGQLWATPAELAAVGLQPPATPAPDQAGLVPLAALSGVTLQFDRRAQRLLVTAETAARIAAGIGPGATERLPVAPTPFGALLNYDVIATGAGRQSAASALLETRAFGPWGVLSSAGLATAGPAAAGQNPWVRLDTAWSWADPETMRRVQVGDLVTGGLSWTRPVRLGGAQVATDFSLQPNLLTFPIPAFRGEAAVPSTAELLVNGVRQFSQPVEPGPFEIRQPPVIAGAGTVAVVVRDALGRQTVTELPFYVGAGLLREGLYAWSVEGGAVRRNWGIVSNGYDRAAGSATVRVGVTDWLTLEGHGEGMAGTGMAGVGVAARVGTLGIVTASVAGSGGGRRGGAQATLGFERQGQVFSFAAAVTRGTPGFRDIASLTGSPVVRSAWRVGGGISLGRFGSVGVAYVAQTGSFDSAAAAFGQGLTGSGSNGSGVTGFGGAIYQPAASYALLTASYTVPLSERMTFYATGYQSVQGAGGFGVSAGLSISLQPRRSAAASTAWDRNGGLSAGARFDQAATLPGEYGLHVLDQEGAAARRVVQAEYLSTAGRVGAGVAQGSGQLAGQLEAHGAVVLAGGGLFASDRIDDSFAVVRSGDIPNVGVLAENRPVGRTDSGGRLLVPNLRAWDANTLALDPVDLPADVDATSLTTRVAPRARAGAVVDFGAHRVAGAVVVLTDPAGQPVPVGAPVRIEGADGGSGVVGFGGETWLTGLSAHNAVTVALPGGGACHARFDFAPADGAQPRIGPVRCTP